MLRSFDSVSLPSRAELIDYLVTWMTQPKPENDSVLALTSWILRSPYRVKLPSHLL